MRGAQDHQVRQPLPLHRGAGGIDQLLGYLTWRDCKAAMIVFNKHNAEFSRILKALPRSLSAHPKQRGELQELDTAEWRSAFASQEDEHRQVTMHFFLFNLYSGGC